MQKSNFFFLILIFLISCGAPRHIRNNFECYDGQNGSIDSLININGYYLMTGSYDNRTKKRPIKAMLHIKGDSINTNMMFLKDGIFVYGFHNYNQEIREYIEDIINKTSMGKTHPFFQWYSWGNYSINTDTIKAQYINHPGIFANTWMGYEAWFKVIDRNTIKLIASRKLYYDRLHQDKSEMDLVFLNDEDCLIANFIPLDTIPPPNTWLKKRKWFWCDKKDMKVYKRNLKK